MLSQVLLLTGDEGQPVRLSVGFLTRGPDPGHAGESRATWREPGPTHPGRRASRNQLA